MFLTEKIRYTPLLFLVLAFFLTLSHEPVPSFEVKKGEFTFYSEEEWLLQCQLQGGAIAQTPWGDKVIPYFANAAAAVMIDFEPQRTKSYMDWYLSNINLSDRWGFSGTIYDYDVRGGELTPTGDYDSADSYASTFLALVSEYHDKTGDEGYLRDNMANLQRVASVLLNLQDSDGLIFVKPNSKTKYLMDNAENYLGLMRWAETLNKLGEKDEAKIFYDAALKVKEGINTRLYNPKEGCYAWVLSWYGKRYPRNGVWYPDGVSQVSLILNRVFEPSSTDARSIWERFNEHFPRWPHGEKNDVFPWVNIAFTAGLMGDLDRQKAFLLWAKEEYRDRSYPWHVQESAYALRTFEIPPR